MPIRLRVFEVFTRLKRGGVSSTDSNWLTGAVSRESPSTWHARAGSRLRASGKPSCSELPIRCDRLLDSR